MVRTVPDDGAERDQWITRHRRAGDPDAARAVNDDLQAALTVRLGAHRGVRHPRRARVPPRQGREGVRGRVRGPRPRPVLALAEVRGAPARGARHDLGVLADLPGAGGGLPHRVRPRGPGRDHRRPRRRHHRPLTSTRRAVGDGRPVRRQTPWCGTTATTRGTRSRPPSSSPSRARSWAPWRRSSPRNRGSGAAFWSPSRSSAAATADRQSASSEWAADMADGLRTKAKVKQRTRAADEADKVRGLDRKLARGNALTRPYAVATVTVPKTVAGSRSSGAPLRLDASRSPPRAGFAPPTRLDLRPGRRLRGDSSRRSRSGSASPARPGRPVRPRPVRPDLFDADSQVPRWWRDPPPPGPGRDVGRLLADFGHDLPAAAAEPARAGRRGCSPRLTPRPRRRARLGRVTGGAGVVLADDERPGTGAVATDRHPRPATHRRPDGHRRAVRRVVLRSTRSGGSCATTSRSPTPTSSASANPAGQVRHHQGVLLRMMDFGYRALVLGDPKDEYEPLCTFSGSTRSASAPACPPGSTRWRSGRWRQGGTPWTATARRPAPGSCSGAGSP
jgi:hypothetical protein